MATFEAALILPRIVTDAFAFVSDFGNAKLWDPRTYASEKLTPGPVGVGTRFLLQGGPVSKDMLTRLHVPPPLRMTSELPYEVKEFDPPRLVVLAGETEHLTYEDRIELTAEGAVTRLVYKARLDLKGWREIAEPALALLFQTIGREATEGMPRAVDRYAPGLPPTEPAITTPAAVEKVVGDSSNPKIRNLLITQGYHDLSQATARITGGVDMSWCTLGTWASKTAGTFIRDDEVPSIFMKLLEASPHVHRAVDDAKVALATASPVADAAHVGLLDIARQTIDDCADYIMVGNRVVFAELGGCFARFLEELGNDTAFDEKKLAAFQAHYTEGDPQPDEAVWNDAGEIVSTPKGGQGLLRSMAGHLYRAMFEKDEKKRAELVLFANAEGGLHEQTRLQTYIAGGLDAPITELLLPDAHRRVEESVPEGPAREAAHAAVEKVLRPLAQMLEDAWQDFSTRHLMTLTLPDGVLHLSRPIPQDPGQPMMPKVLETIDDPDLAAVLAKYRSLDVELSESTLGWFSERMNELFGWPPRGPDRLADVGAVDWTIFDQRMRFILTLFRLRQEDVHLFASPFNPEQRAAMFAGQMPEGPL